MDSPVFQWTAAVPSLLRMRQIRLWVAVILVITVVGALFLVTTSKINNKARAYTLGQYRLKDTKVADRPMYTGGGFNDFVGLNESDPHGPKLINVKHVSKSRKKGGETADDDFLVFEAKVEILGNIMHYREASNGWVPKMNVMLFTGQHFTSSIWNDIGTMEDLAALGYRVVSLELPGHGLSREDPEKKIRVAEYIKLFVQHLDLYRPGLVVLTCDESNSNVLEYFIRYSHTSPLLKGLIVIDSAADQFVSMDRILGASIDSQTLFLCGGTDSDCQTSSNDWARNIPNSRVHSFSNAYKEFYNEDPVVFNTILKRFLEYVSTKPQSEKI